MSKAAKKGLTADEIISQSAKIEQMEKKYSKSFDELLKEFDNLEKAIHERSKSLKELDESISAAEKKRSDLFQNNAVDEGNVQEYIRARDELSLLGFPVDDISKVNTFLSSIKGEQYSVDGIIEKIDAIGDLESRRKSLEAELYQANLVLLENNESLNEIQKVRRTGLSIDKIEKIRDLVSRIGSKRGVNADLAFSQFESDVLRNYDLALGLEDELKRLLETKRSMESEFQERRKSLEVVERSIQSRISELESSHQNKLANITAYQDLRESGIETNDVIALHELLFKLNLNLGVVMSILRRTGNLKDLEGEISNEIEILRKEKDDLNASVSGLKDQRRVLESSVSLMRDTLVKELRASRETMISLVTQITDEAKSILKELSNGVKSTLVDTEPSIDGFSSELRRLFEKTEMITRNFPELMNAMERVSEYRTIIPLVKLAENSPVSEKDALVAMSTVSSIFIQWMEKQQASEGRLESLGKMKEALASLNKELQSVDQEIDTKESDSKHLEFNLQLS